MMYRVLFFLFLSLSPDAKANSTLSARGSKLVDAQGHEVRLLGVNWFGFETDTRVVHGLWARPYREYLALIKKWGFNFLRLPFSNSILRANAKPQGAIDYSKNPDLKGLTSLQILDKIVAEAARLGLRVMLDRHRPDESGMSELWYTAKVSEVTWLEDWKTLALRYKHQPAVVAFDLHNEPHGPATWAGGDPKTDWRLAAEKAGNAIHAINPHLLIVVCGVQYTPEGAYWWGGNLTRAKAEPVRLKVPNKVVYAAHDYPASVYNQPWFQDPTYPSNLPSVWDKYWGYLTKQGVAPVLLGEFGTRLKTPRDRQWLESLTAYLKGNQHHFAFWALNPNSGDTGGLLEDDWHTEDTLKLGLVKKAF